MKLTLGLLAFTIGFVLPVSSVFSQGEKVAVDSFEGFPEFAEQVMAEWGVPGMAVGVVKDGQVVYMQGFGYRDVEKQLPVTPKTLFAICSSTKAFTAMAIGMLVDDGKLDLDTPLIDYMPDFRLYDDYATLHATPRIPMEFTETQALHAWRSGYSAKAFASDLVELYRELSTSPILIPRKVAL